MIAVGLELGSNVIKMAVVESARGGFQVRAFEVHKIDAKKGEVDDDVVSIVSDAFRRLKAPRNDVVASVRAQDCMIREILVPFTDDDKIRKTVKYQAENYFSSVPIDDLIIEYSKFAEIETKSKLLVAGIKKSHIDRRLRFLEECYVDPLAIDVDVGALYNAYAAADRFEGLGAALIVDIESDTLKIGVVEEGKLRLARAIRMRVSSMKLDKGGNPRKDGGSGIYDTAADESARLPVVILDEGDDEAFSLEDSGISETERQGIIHRIFMEIDRTVASVQLNQEVDQILLSGASCALEGIETIFSEHFEIPAQRVDVGKLFGAPGGLGKKERSQLGLQGGTAVGLALKGLGVDHSGLDFRQEEFSYRGTFDLLKRGLACTLTLFFALTFLYAFTLKQDLRERNNSLQAVKGMEKNLYTVLFPSLDDLSMDHLPLAIGKPEDQRYYESLKSEHDRLKNKFEGSGEAGTRVSSLEVLRRFTQARAKVPATFNLEVRKVRVDPRPAGKSTFTCLASHNGAAIELERALNEDDLITGTAQSAQKDKKSGKWLFTIVVELREEDKS